MAEASMAIVPVTEIDPNDRGREYRKGNWTLHETMVLITAKKLDDERRMKGGDKEKGKSAEFRWKWVENYCWKNGCQRSQNQCNDKWDNLLRDYKKVRDHETRIQPGQRSYWQLEKHERKDKGLPSNLLIQVYDALHEIVDKRPSVRPMQILPSPLSERASSSLPLSQSMSQLGSLPLPSPPSFQPLQHPQVPQPPPPPPPPPQAYPEPSKSSGSEGSGVQRPSTKRRKISSVFEDLAPAISRSASELTQTLLACEEKKEKRHRDILGMEERKLILEETKAEFNRQGIEGLIGAVNNLANAIQTLVSQRNRAAAN